MKEQWISNMRQRIRFLNVPELALSVALAIGLLAAGMPIAIADEQANSTIFPEAHYRFVLNLGSAADVCRRVDRMFNQSFTRMWDAEMLLSESNAYADSGAYAFPRLNGVAHNNRFTFDMRFSRYPTSAEFDAIVWTESRGNWGSTSGTADQPDIVVPILVTHVDVDGDGTTDSLVKFGFNQGYSYFARGGGSNGLNNENIWIWFGRVIEVSALVEMQQMVSGTASVPVPAWIGATWIRPFIFKGQTYFARYVINLDEDFTRPENESMDVLKLRAPMAASKKQPLASTICHFDMKPVP